MNQELSDLRKKVAMSTNMKSFINKLSGVEDMQFEMKFIADYSRKKFQIFISSDDFSCLSREEISDLYKKTKDASKSDKFSLVYRFMFDIGVAQLEKLLNTYVFSISNLKQTLVYDDIALEIEELFHDVQEKTIGKYVDQTSPLLRIAIYFISQIIKAKM